MLNEAQISLTGYVATQPVTRTTGAGSLRLTMRVAWTPRRRDWGSGEWMDGNTSYVSVVCWRRLASNVATCMRKGDPVVVKGRLSVRSYEKDGVTRTAVEVEASSVGHDLSLGVAQFQRVRPQTGMTANEFAAARPDEARADRSGLESDRVLPEGERTAAPVGGDLDGYGEALATPGEVLVDARPEDAREDEPDDDFGDDQAMGRPGGDDRVAAPF